MCPTEKVQQLTLFPEGTLDLASLLVTPGSEKARKMTATSGRNILGWFKKSDPVGLLVRMLLDTSLWASTTCLLTWKVKDTPRGRLFYQLVPSVPDTDEIGFSLWRTPAAANANQGPKSKEFYEHCLRTGQSTVTLVDEVRHNPGKMWPTPRANKIGGESSPGFSPTLEQTVKMWPTPTTNDANNATLPPAAEDWDIIPGALMREGYTKEDGQLNPEWVEVLMNFPIGWTEV